MAGRVGARPGWVREGEGMLFFLTGDVQIGKTRWLDRTIGELARAGVPSAGVLAPGVWRERAEGEGAPACAAAGAGRYEKLGIDNVLLPQGERVAFARRRDLAAREGSYRPGSQSAAAQLVWEIDDAAIARVNAHFDRLAAGVGDGGNLAAAAGAQGGGEGAGACGRVLAPAGAVHGGDSAAVAGAASNGEAQPPAGTPAARGGLLVVDELGQLELLRGGGLSSAVALLQAGPSARFPHAVAVVRDWLLEQADGLLAEAWPERASIAPGEDARRALRTAFGLGV